MYPLTTVKNGWAKIPLSLLGNGSVKMLPRQRKHMQQQNNWQILKGSDDGNNQKKKKKKVVPNMTAECIVFREYFIIKQPHR
jgi:hypothetical protein